MPRKFVPIPVDELKDKILEAAKKTTYWEDHGDVNFMSGNVFRALTPTVDKDLSKVNFDLENFESSNDKYDTWPHCGFHTLPNGLSFQGFSAGGDWEHPVYFIIYWDGTKLRGYIPTEGNTFNRKTKYSYGNAYEVVAKNRKKGEAFNSKKHNEECEKYDKEEAEMMRKYGDDHDQAKLFADIQKRIQPK